MSAKNPNCKEILTSSDAAVARLNEKIEFLEHQIELTDIEGCPKCGGYWIVGVVPDINGDNSAAHCKDCGHVW